jgi:hypothetical protein
VDTGGRQLDQRLRVLVVRQTDNRRIELAAGDQFADSLEAGNLRQPFLQARETPLLSGHDRRNLDPLPEPLQQFAPSMSMRMIDADEGQTEGWGHLRFQIVRGLQRVIENRSRTC